MVLAIPIHYLFHFLGHRDFNEDDFYYFKDLFVIPKHLTGVLVNELAHYFTIPCSRYELMLVAFGHFIKEYFTFFIEL